MDAARAARALADVSAGMVVSNDIPGHLSNLVRSCQVILTADAGGILVAENGGDLELLVASSHEAAELELHQAQTVEGPCIDAHASGEAVTLSSAEELVERWPEFGAHMTSAGFHSVHAAPLTWQGNTIGAMGMFRRNDIAFTAEEHVMAQAFADLATVLIVHSDRVDLDLLGVRVTEALKTRVLIEQAKGALAEQHSIDMSEAYLRLVEASETMTLTQTAQQILDAARRLRR